MVPYAPTVIRTRPFNFLRGLARRGVSVTLVTLWQTEAERASLRALEQEGIAVHALRLTRARALRNGMRALPGTAPLQASYAWLPALAAQARALAAPASCDVVHVEHLRGARYALALRTQAPVVWDSVDCISHLFAQARSQTHTLRARLMAGVELGRTRQYEGMLVRNFDRVLVTSALDKLALEALAGPPAGTAGSVVVVPNGVDLESFSPPNEPRQPGSLVLSGKMAYHANVTAVLYFMRAVMPLIWRERPATTLAIVGQSPPAAIRSLTADPRITVTGEVASMRPYLARASVAVCPVVYGAGIQNKVLEAMACATPVVSTEASLRALGATPESEALLGASAPEFARQVLRLLNDSDLANRVGAAGRRFVESRYSWDAAADRLMDNYEEVIELWKSRKP